MTQENENLQNTQDTDAAQGEAIQDPAQVSEEAPAAESPQVDGAAEAESADAAEASSDNIVTRANADAGEEEGGVNVVGAGIK